MYSHQQPSLGLAAKAKKLIEEEEEALAEKAEAQKKLKPDSDPLFDKDTVVEIKKRVNDALQKLEDTPKPPPPPPKVEEEGGAKKSGEL